jgi:uncharacterized protein YqhQ
MVFGLAMGLCLIVVIPNVIAEIAKWLGVRGAVPLALLDGVVRLGIFLATSGWCRGMHYIRRVFQYHGASTR